MKKIIFTFAAFVLLLSTPVFAQDAAAEAENPFPSLHKVEAKYVCMVNNRVFPIVQIPVEVEGKTYYGCCAMCEARLQKDASLRKGVDPVSGAEVDKADAVIGAKRDGSVYYFENEENYEAFQE
ncbi:MAG: hypothetical protein HND56_01880 [Pseudomonadota bacterium]|nr:hypothetical protein [Pseudomonadota bacterium]QKK04510.1 MAG: hypothetical protein HND56_01880 [Pseudomonadota bacterium]